MDPNDEAVLGLLQAYVDDALPADEATRVRAAIDADPALRRAERALRKLSDEISIFVALGGFPPPGPGGGGPPRQPDVPPVRPVPVVGSGVRPVVRVGSAPPVRVARPRRALATPAAWLMGAVVLAVVGIVAVAVSRTRQSPARPDPPP